MVGLLGGRMSTLDRAFVLQPFTDLFASSHSTVLLGLRLLEKVQTLPGPTDEELQFFQFSAGPSASDPENGRAHFKRWLLLKGFGDVQHQHRAAKIHRSYRHRSRSETIRWRRCRDSYEGIG